MKLLKYILSVLLFGLWIAAGLDTALAQDTDLSELIRQAREAGIEQAALDELQGRAQSRGISDQELASFIRPAVELAKQDLPADMVIQKSLEGLAKGVPGNRIIPVLNDIRHSTENAAGIVDPWIQKSEVQSMLDRSGRSDERQDFRNALTKATSRVLMKDVSAEAVQNIFSDIGNSSVMNQSSPSDIVAAVGILPDLPSTVGNPQMSGDIIVKALKSGFTAAELQKLPSAVNMAQSQSRLPAAAILEGLGKQLQGGIPAQRILQNLFNGNIGGGPPGDIPKGLENKPPGRGKGSGNSGGNG